jgi:hypothetical protein
VKIDEGNDKQITKVFFIESILGKRCIQSYKKVKPASVQLSPGVRGKTVAKKYTVLSNEGDTQPPLTTSFRLKQCLNHEKFWRAMFLSENVMVREVFFGVSPTGIRILDPATLEPEIVFDKLQVYNLKYGQYMGNTALKVKYYLETGTGATKLKKLRLHVLPVTAQDILRWYDYCSNFGEEADTISKLPVFKPDDAKPAKRTTLQRGNSVSDLKAKSNPPIIKETTNLQNPKPRSLAKSTSSKQTEPMTRLSSSNKENQPPSNVKYRKCNPSKPPLTKSKSALDAFGRV